MSLGFEFKSVSKGDMEYLCDVNHFVKLDLTSSTFHSSPRKSFQPIEIVVRHNKVVEQSASDSDEDDGTNGRSGQQKRLTTVHEGELFRKECQLLESTQKWNEHYSATSITKKKIVENLR